MKKTIGIFSHVDAGKTTFSEQLLYLTKSIRKLGRVDHKTTTLDTNEIEKERGITIFSGQGVFQYNDDTYYIIDTPGHVDFSNETEGTINALDYAIILISGTSKVQSHTNTLFKLLESYSIPIFIFINKIDMEGFVLEEVLNDIKDKLARNIVYIPSYNELEKLNSDVCEITAEYSDSFLERYLNDNYNFNDLSEKLVDLINVRKIYPVLMGSALKGVGIRNFINIFSCLTSTNYEEVKKDVFEGKVFKVRYFGGIRITFIKAISGQLKVKDEFIFESENNLIYKEKVNEIRIYNGDNYKNVDIVEAGDVFAVAGFLTPKCGSIIQIGEVLQEEIYNYKLLPPLEAKVNILDDTNIIECIEKFKILEDENPTLSANYNTNTKELLVHVMGKIQLEVLEKVLKNRFNVEVRFDKPNVQYKETITDVVVGYGHFEPLRHYAEAKIELVPLLRNSGILFENDCHIDNLLENYQNLIKLHVFEKEHRGILTGSPITDIKVVLKDGRAHIKHTSGGDFREATYRAIRQGLEKANMILLEPYYSFEIYVNNEYLGKVLSDIQKMNGMFEAPEQKKDNVCIRGKGPVINFVDYSVEINSFTSGTGSISLVYHGYDLCNNQDEIIKKIGYKKNEDKENISSSIFCSKGTSFTVKWNESEKYMHTKK